MPPARTAQRTAPRTKPADQRRRDLLEAGLQVFLERGVAATTLEHITKAAGVAKGTFYLYFDSKEQLLVALQREFEARMVQRIEQAVLAADPDWAARLDAWLDAALADYPSERALHDVLFHHPVLATHEADADEHSGAPDLAGSLAGLIGAGVAAGAFDTLDPELTAMLLCSALHRMFDRIWHQDQEIDPEHLAAATRQLFRRAVAVGQRQ